MFKKIFVFIAVVASITAFAKDGKVTCSVASTVLPDDDTQRTLSWDFNPGEAMASMFKTQTVQLGGLKISISMNNINGEPHFGVLVLDTEKKIDKSKLGDGMYAEQDARTVLRNSGTLSERESLSSYSNDKQSLWVRCKFEAKAESSISNKINKPLFQQPIISSDYSCTDGSCSRDANHVE